MGKSNKKIVAENRKARFNYFIEDEYEAGIVLTGTEVKSLRDGRANLKDAYARIQNGEIFLQCCGILSAETAMQPSRILWQPVPEGIIYLVKNSYIPLPLVCEGNSRVISERHRQPYIHARVSAA